MRKYTLVHVNGYFDLIIAGVGIIVCGQGGSYARFNPEDRAVQVELQSYKAAGWEVLCETNEFAVLDRFMKYREKVTW